MGRIRIVLAEDHHVVRAAIAFLLAKEAELDVVGWAIAQGWASPDSAGTEGGVD